MLRHSFAWLAWTALWFVCVGCENKVAPANAALAVVEVNGKAAVTQLVRDYREYTGRTVAVNSVDVRARVSGYLKQSPQAKTSVVVASTLPQGADSNAAGVTVTEGGMVKKGVLLFQIDPQPYELAFQQSKGSLTAAEAHLKQVNQDLDRIMKLLNSNAVSQAEVDQAVAAVAETQGQISNLEAVVARAELDLKFTRVDSPIDGLLGRTLVTNGNLVTADVTILTTVVSTDPIYVDFDVDEQSLLDYRQRMRQGEVEGAREGRISVGLALANEEGFPHQGVINFVDNRTDPGTGNTRVRAAFDNQQGILSPGLFARVQVPFTSQYNAVLVPTESLGMDQQGQFVMVVNDQKVSRRDVVSGSIHDGLTVIREGLAGGEMVVTSGLQKIRPGSQVKVVPETQVKTEP